MNTTSLIDSLQLLEARDRDRAEKLQRAFSIVGPTPDWRAPIDLKVSASLMYTILEVTGLTIQDLKDSVMFHTATELLIDFGTSGPTNNPVWHLTAVGYRNGPAGP